MGLWLLAVGWSLLAAAVWYTNYFGIVVVSLTWCCGAFRLRGVRGAMGRWGVALLLTLLFYVPWLKPFWVGMRKRPGMV